MSLDILTEKPLPLGGGSSLRTYKGFRDHETREPTVIVQKQDSKNFLQNYRKKADQFGWGYAGAGSADLAYSILTDILGEALALKYYQVFKWDRVVSFEFKEWVIKEGEVQEYIAYIEEKNK